MTAFETARAAFEAGVAAVARGELAAAEAHFAASLAALPGRPSTLANLGAVRLRLGRPADALAVLDEVHAMEPDSPDVLLNRGLALAEVGRLDEGVGSLDRLLELEPDRGIAWGRRGAMLKDLGRWDEAARSLRRAIELGDDPVLNRFVLASLEGGTAPAAPPPHYVEGLFDGYADGFDEHLVDRLGYRAPQQLLALLPADETLGDVLDLGCGSGIAAAHWAPRCRALDGVDLSTRMLARARARGQYRRLTHADAVAHLSTLHGAYAAIVAADVFIYVGALDALMAAARDALQPGGRLAYTVEEAPPGVDWRLAPSTRYQHGEGYLRALARTHGWTVTAFERAPLRRDRQGWIGGILAVYTRP